MSVNIENNCTVSFHWFDVDNHVYYLSYERVKLSESEWSFSCFIVAGGWVSGQR